MHFTPHMARHRYATELNRGGATPLDIRAAGSWTSTEAIDRYVKVDEDRVREVIDRLGYRPTANCGETAEIRGENKKIS